jgi:ABC-type antimicrobial peptide transport system permease subunit
MAVVVGLTFAAVIGALGGFLPALAASRRDLLQSLREG